MHSSTSVITIFIEATTTCGLGQLIMSIPSDPVYVYGPHLQCAPIGELPTFYLSKNISLKDRFSP